MQARLSADRRTERTKKSLADALKALILEKGYDAITIQDLLDRANVGRSTFYSHYESKEELLLGNINFQTFLVHIPTDDYAQYPMGINIAYLFSHLKENVHIGKVLFRSRAIDVLSNHFAEMCTLRIWEYHKKRSTGTGAGNPMLRYRAAAAAGAIIRMLFQWLEDGAVVPVEEMVVYSKRILEFS